VQQLALTVEPIETRFGTTLTAAHVLVVVAEWLVAMKTRSTKWTQHARIFAPFQIPRKCGVRSVRWKPAKALQTHPAIAVRDIAWGAVSNL